MLPDLSIPFEASWRGCVLDALDASCYASCYVSCYVWRCLEVRHTGLGLFRRSRNLGLREIFGWGFSYSLRRSQEISGDLKKPHDQPWYSSGLFLRISQELHLNSSISCHPAPCPDVTSSAVSRRWILCLARGGKCCTISTSLGDLLDLLARSSHKTWQNVPQAPLSAPPWWCRASVDPLCELPREQD